MYISYKKLLKLNKDLEKEIKIGKKGITTSLEKEIIKLLLIKKALKIRVLKNCPISFEEIINRITNLSKNYNVNFLITHIKGRTFILVLEESIRKINGKI